MKNLFYLMLSIAFIGVMLVSCDSENENDFIVEDKIEGLRFLIPADPPAIEIDADVDDFEIISPSSRPEASNSRNVYCTEYIRITDLLFTQSFCTPTTSAQRCQYLNGFYSLAALFYEYDCVPEVFCANCESYAAFGEEFLAWTIANGINPSGIQDMIDRIAENCENCPSEDPCEEECEGVDVTVGYEEIEINGKPCCRVTWTLVDPNGCTDGTIIAGTGSNGPFIPTIFNTNNSGILSASHCDVETNEYWIQTGGECPQVFGPFSLDCDSQDPCEDECEGVDIDVKEEIVINFENRECCRLTFTLLDPNGCTDGTITEVRIGATGPWIPGLFTSISQNTLQATSCDVETQDYYIRTGGECPVEFGPYNFDCHL